nr:MAG: hypothetical protein [Lokiarchaeota virus Skoll Meg22_1214]
MKSEKNRTCPVCGRKLFFIEFFKTNHGLLDNSMDKFQYLHDIWENELIRILCCNCFNTIMKIRKYKPNTNPFKQNQKIIELVCEIGMDGSMIIHEHESVPFYETIDAFIEHLNATLHLKKNKIPLKELI